MVVIPRAFSRLPLLCLALCAFLLETVVPAPAAAPMEIFRLSQIAGELPELAVYFAALDGDGAPVAEIGPEQLAVTVGPQAAEVTAVAPFSRTGEGVAYILLVDISKSMRAEQFRSVRDALAAWVDAMGDADRACLIAFGSEVNTVMDFTGDRSALKTAIAALRLTDNDTRLHQGLARGLDLGRRLDPDLPARRAIVVLSDGENDVRGDFEGGMTRAELERRVAEHPVPVYAVGFLPRAANPRQQEHLKLFAEMVRGSGGDFFLAGQTPFPEMFQRMRRAVLDVFAARVSCPACAADGGIQRIQARITRDARVLSDGMDARLFPPAAPPAPDPPEPLPEAAPVPEPVVETVAEPEPEPPTPWWKTPQGVGTLVGGAFLALLLAVFVLRRRKRQAPEDEDAGESGFSSPAWDEGPPPEEVPAEPVPTGRALRFTRVGGDGRVFSAVLGEGLVLGRGQSAGLAIPDDSEISGRHCELIRHGEAVFVRDLDSTNGTYVNGALVSADMKLHHHDVLRIGRTELRVTLEGL